jgi:hypothetical protein
MTELSIKAIIPPKGKCSRLELQRQSDPEFIKAKRSHNAIESNINELEHRGLNRFPDKGIRGMHRYVGLAVIAYNLRRTGQLLLAEDRRRVNLRRAA